MSLREAVKFAAIISATQDAVALVGNADALPKRFSRTFVPVLPITASREF